MNKKDQHFTNKYTCIFDAILEKDIKGIKFFLQYKDHKKDNFSLRLAVKNRDLEIVELLLKMVMMLIL